ncbi:MAG TPA: hypothetical protein PK481_06415 [Bacillota bacterium]|nr:hypothetical protein [Bacillota bacterium]
MRKRTISVLVAITFLFLPLLGGCSPNASPEKSGEAPLECDWTIKVDQTIPIKEGDVTVNYSLVLIAQKTGGTDVYGTYEGAAYIGSQLDASELSKEFVKIGGGFDVNAFANNLSFEIEPFDKERYSAYGSKDKASLAPLAEYESMALLSPEMKGGAIIDVDVKAIDGTQGGYNDSGIGASPVDMKIAIYSGKVHVDIPVLNIDRSFEGLITGDPKRNNEEYRQVVEKIEELIAESESEPDSPDNGGGESIGGIMGEFGSNLEIPASFPADEFPILPNSVIINTYESEDKRNVRVMVGTNASLEDIQEFYKEYIIEKPEVEKLDIPDGVMYSGRSDKYSNFMLTVMKDMSTTYSYMASLEVMKR